MHRLTAWGGPLALLAGLGAFARAGDPDDAAVPAIDAGLRSFVGSVPPGETLVGIDENTAIVGDGRAWEVVGRSGAHVMRDGEWNHRTAGDPFSF